LLSIPDKADPGTGTGEESDGSIYQDGRAAEGIKVGMPGHLYFAEQVGAMKLPGKEIRA
jgi:hypothetical protein